MVGFGDMGLNAIQLSALSRLFSSGVFREMATKGRSPMFTRLMRDADLLSEIQSVSETVGTTFDAAFALLRRAGTRDEYVYRAALTHNILLGRHSLNTASMLTEFRAGACKADVAILNGTSSVYEIKSERDSLSRLANQIANYRKVFAKVYVVAGESHIDEVLQSTPRDVGVMSLVRWDRIRTIREATDRADTVCPETIFESLRVNEARTILSNLQVPIPDVPNTLLRSALKDRFRQLEPAMVHDQMVLTLKQSRGLAALKTFVDELPHALKPVLLAAPMRKSADYRRLLDAVNTPLHVAMGWA